MTIQTAQAEQCTDVLNKCGIAVKDLQNVNAIQKSVIDAQDKEIVDQKKLIDDQNAWYRDPVKIGLLGILTGIVVRGFIK